MEHHNEATAGQIRTGEIPAGTDEGKRLAQGRFLDELPGAAFAIITLIWVVSMFAGLIWRDMPAEMMARYPMLAQAFTSAHALAAMSRATAAAGLVKTALGAFDPRRPV